MVARKKWKFPCLLIPYEGSKRQDAMTTKQAIFEAIEQLPEHRLADVLRYIQQLARTQKSPRKVDTREVRQRFLIVCEGKKTEPATAVVLL